MAGTTFGGAVVNQGTWSDGGKLIFDDTFTNNAGATFTPSSAAGGTTFDGAVVNQGAWNANSSSVRFQAALTNASGTITAGSGPFACFGSFTNQSTFNAGSGALSFFDVALAMGSMFNAGTANVVVTGDWTTTDTPGVFDPGTGTVTFAGAGPQVLDMAYWTGTPTVTIRPTDSFESWSGDSPAGWTEQVVHLPPFGVANWYAYGAGAPGGGDRSAGFTGAGADCSHPPYCFGGASARIFTTAPFTTTGYSSCSVRFDFLGYESAPATNGHKCLQLEGSSDSGNLGAVGSAICTDSGAYGWTQKTIDLNGYAGRAAVRLGLRGTDFPSYFGSSSYNDFAVDLLTVECLKPELDGRNTFYDLVVGGDSELATANPLVVKGDLTVTAGGVLTAGGDVAVTGNLIVDTDGVFDLGTHELTVDGCDVINWGTLRQTKDVTGATEFLHIRNAAGTREMYYGVNITPAAGSLGSTTVAIRGNQSQCTGNLGAPVLQRCLDITPTTPVGATIRYYFTAAELNGQAANQLKLYHFDTTWQQVGSDYTYSESSIRCRTRYGEACWLQAENVSAFSPFVLGSAAATTVPVAVTGELMTSANDLVLQWTHQSPNTAYEVWRGATPYFPFSGPDAGILLTTLPITTQLPGALMSYADTGRLADGNSYFYVIRSLLSGAVAQSIGNGKFLFELEPGQ